MRFKLPRFNRSVKHTQDVEFTPTFFPLELVQALLTNGLTANQKKFLDLYLTVPELQAIINYKARVFSGMQIKAVKNEQEKEIPQLKLFAQPNPLQNFKEFSSQYYVLRAIFGNEFIHPVFGLRKDNVKALWNLPSMNAEVIPIDNNVIPFNMTEIDELIKGYKFWFNGKHITYGAEEIIHYNDNQVQFEKERILLGDSKIRPLIQACDNIKNSYEARGILILNSALGILSNETSDQAGSVPMAPKDKDQLQKDFKESYGLVRHKHQLLITNASLKWQSMAINTGNLKLFEEVEGDFKAIAHAYSFPPEVLLTSSTYENKEKALIQLYNEAIIPEANEWLQGLANWMELDFELKADFSHIAVLQLDKERASKSINWAAQGLVKAKDGGLIDETDAKETFTKFLP